MAVTVSIFMGYLMEDILARFLHMEFHEPPSPPKNKSLILCHKQTIEGGVHKKGKMGLICMFHICTLRNITPSSFERVEQFKYL
jgi:hypothetical protein